MKDNDDIKAEEMRMEWEKKMKDGDKGKENNGMIYI
jgi:hypothetical protein